MELSIFTIGIIILLVLVPTIILITLFYYKINNIEKKLKKTMKSYKINNLEINKENELETSKTNLDETENIEHFNDENNVYDKSKNKSLNWEANMKILANGSLPLLKTSKKDTGQHVKGSLSNYEYFDINQ